MDLLGDGRSLRTPLGAVFKLPDGPDRCQVGPPSRPEGASYWPERQSGTADELAHQVFYGRRKEFEDARQQLNMLAGSPSLRGASAWSATVGENMASHMLTVRAQDDSGEAGNIPVLVHFAV